MECRRQVMDGTSAWYTACPRSARVGSALHPEGAAAESHFYRQYQNIKGKYKLN